MNNFLHKGSITGPAVNKIRRQTIVLLFLTMLIGICSGRVMAKPLKVYILAGQSNMDGHAKVSTFDHIGMDPKTAPILKEMRVDDGTLRVCKKVWISYFRGPEAGGEGFGKLTAGYGSRKDPTKDGGKIGPEFTFGIYMEKFLDEPILIIKTAWGGKSLNTDFRPPSAGPYEFNKYQLELFKKQGKDIEQLKTDKIEATGRYYRLMIEHVKRVLDDPKRVCPEYDPEQGYELAGFVWFQGWNDMVDRQTYPDRDKPGGYDMYSELLAHFIRDVRKELSALKMRFVIGVMGVGGPIDNSTGEQANYKSVHDNFRKAMAALAAMPEFKGNVTAVLTEKYWDVELGELAARWDKVKAKSRTLSKDKSLSDAERTAALDKYKAELYTPEEMELYQKGCSNAAYHYLGSAKIMAQIGKAFAEAMVQ